MDLLVGAGSYWLVPIAGYRGSNGLLAHFFLPRRFGITFFGKVPMGKIANENASRMAVSAGSGELVFVFRAESSVYRTTPRHRGVFKSKMCLLSTEHRMQRCNKAPIHTNYRIPPPCTLRFSGWGLGMVHLMGT